MINGDERNIKFITVVVTLPVPPRNQKGTTPPFLLKGLEKVRGTTFSLSIPRWRKCDHYGKYNQLNFPWSQPWEMVDQTTFSSSLFIINRQVNLGKNPKFSKPFQKHHHYNTTKTRERGGATGAVLLAPRSLCNSIETERGCVMWAPQFLLLNFPIAYKPYL